MHSLQYVLLSHPIISGQSIRHILSLFFS